MTDEELGEKKSIQFDVHEHYYGDVEELMLRALILHSQAREKLDSTQAFGSVLLGMIWDTAEASIHSGCLAELQHAARTGKILTDEEVIQALEKYDHCEYQERQTKLKEEMTAQLVTLRKRFSEPNI